MNLMIQPMKMKMRKTRMILVKLRTKTLMRMKLNKKAMKQKKTTEASNFKSKLRLKKKKAMTPIKSTQKLKRMIHLRKALFKIMMNLELITFQLQTTTKVRVFLFTF